WLQQQQTSLGWLVAVWRFERCSSRPEGAIQPEFDRPHREVFALKGFSLEVRGVLVPLPVGHCVDPQRQGAGLVPLLQDGESRLVSSRVMNARESDLGAFAERCAQSRPKLLGLHWRQFGVDQSNGIVDENAGGLAVGISNDSTALGIRRRRGDFRAPTRFPTRPWGVAIHSGEENGSAGKQPVQFLSGGKFSASAHPTSLIPPAPNQPVPLIARRRCLFSERQNFLLRFCAYQAERAQALAKIRQVRVSVFNSGDDDRRGKLNHLRFRQLTKHLLPSADGDDLAPPYSQRFGGGLGGVEGSNPASHKHRRFAAARLR